MTKAICSSHTCCALGSSFLLECAFQGSRATGLELWVCRGAGGAVPGSSLSAELSPSVVCGLILVCAHSAYSVGRCQSSNVHAADQPVRVSLFDCLSSWN